MAFALAWLALAGAAAAAGPGPVLAGIEVRGNTRTRTEVILRELLLRLGERLDSALVAETERNLRALSYLGDVHLSVEPQGEDSARVVVEVHDLHARALSPLLTGQLGEASFGAVALDYNFRGRGQVAQVTLFHDAVSGDRVAAFYRDPRLLGSRRQLAVEAGAGRETRNAAVSVSQPFYSLSAPWAYGAALSSARARVRLYRRGHLAARYDEGVDAASLWLVRSCGDRVKVRPGLSLAVSDRRFDADAPFFTYAPRDRRRVVPSLSLTLWRPRFARDRFVRLLGPVEDLQIGGFLTARAGLSARRLGADRDFPFAALTLAPRCRVGDHGYLFGSVSLSARWRDGGYWHLLTGGEAALFARIAERPLTTAALRLAFDAVSRPEDAGSQYLLGVDAGLRGYPPRRFDGTRRLVANAELRPVLVRRTSWILGGVAFADAGAAWRAARSPSLHPAAGAGLRLGLPRVYDTPVLRADLARGLRAGGWQLSFGLGAYF